MTVHLYLGDHQVSADEKLTIINKDVIRLIDSVIKRVEMSSESKDVSSNSK